MERIAPALGDEIEQVRGLMREYGAYLANSAARICIGDYEAEIAGLPGGYAVVLFATVNAEAAGCVAMRAMGGTECELKRLWVGEGFRGGGLGTRLMEAGIGWAREAGYGAVFLDTVPAAMPEANALYERMGFERVQRYNDNPVADVVFFRLGLNDERL